MKRLLCCLFLLLACSSAEATSIAHFDPTLYNIRSFSQYSKVQSDTNSTVSSWAPVRDFLKKNKVAGCSKKQRYFSGLSGGACAISAFYLVVLLLTHSFLRISIGMAFFLLGLMVLSTLLEPEPGPFIVIGIAAGLVLTRDCPRVGKVLTCLCLVTLVVSFLAFQVINRNELAYVDDYAFPVYLVSSTSTNIVVVHEKMDLPYAKYGRHRRQILFRTGRISMVRTNELATLLQAQADEIRRFSQAEPPQKSE